MVNNDAIKIPVEYTWGTFAIVLFNVILESFVVLAIFPKRFPKRPSSSYSYGSCLTKRLTGIPAETKVIGFYIYIFKTLKFNIVANEKQKSENILADGWP